MAVSAIILIAAGILCIFLPQELSAFLGVADDPIVPMMLKIIGAMYFAFGMLNWTAKENIIGGIYGRPIAIANLTHFTIGALSLLKGITIQPHPLGIVILAAAYTIFAILFGIIFFRTPIATQ